MMCRVDGNLLSHDPVWLAEAVGHGAFAAGGADFGDQEEERGEGGEKHCRIGWLIN